MAEIDNKVSVMRVKESGERDATVLENGCLRVMIDDEGGMVPELSLVQGKRVHYTSLRVTNPMGRDLEICAAWHNTLGSPFLAPGCKISGAADLWTTPPPGGEFDATSSLVPGTGFSSLKEAPGAGGKKADISTVPGPTGFTDFAAGRIGDGVHLGWSSLVNPVLKAAYICFFTGPASAAGDDIVLRFNNLWMQYGGRPFTPWAAYEGGADLSYCLGTENSISAYACGLDYARHAGKILGVPATVVIPAGSARTLRYGCLLAPCEKALDEGIDCIEADSQALVCKGKNEFRRFDADPGFKALKLLEGKLTH
jgi:hypothetical protein